MLSFRSPSVGVANALTHGQVTITYCNVFEQSVDVMVRATRSSSGAISEHYAQNLVLTSFSRPTVVNAVNELKEFIVPFELQSDLSEYGAFTEESLYYRQNHRFKCDGEDETNVFFHVYAKKIEKVKKSLSDGSPIRSEYWVCVFQQKELNEEDLFSGKLKLTGDSVPDQDDGTQSLADVSVPDKLFYSYSYELGGNQKVYKEGSWMAPGNSLQFQPSFIVMSARGTRLDKDQAIKLSATQVSTKLLVWTGGRMIDVSHSGILPLKIVLENYSQAIISIHIMLVGDPPQGGLESSLILQSLPTAMEQQQEVLDITVIGQMPGARHESVYTSDRSYTLGYADGVHRSAAAESIAPSSSDSSASSGSNDIKPSTVIPSHDPIILSHSTPTGSSEEAVSEYERTKALYNQVNEENDPTTSWLSLAIAIFFGIIGLCIIPSLFERPSYGPGGAFNTAQQQHMDSHMSRGKPGGPDSSLNGLGNSVSFLHAANAGMDETIYNDGRNTNVRAQHYRAAMEQGAHISRYGSGRRGAGSPESGSFNNYHGYSPGGSGGRAYY